jgi:actin-related protein
MISSFGGNDITAVVFDFGSQNTRVGFAGEYEPRGVFASTPYLATDKHATWPVVDGCVEDWTNYEALVQKSFNYLDIQSKEHPVLLVDAPWNSKNGREQLCELYFEKFNVPGFYLGRSAVLSALI